MVPETKGEEVFSQQPLDRPRGRTVDSIPNRVVIRHTQASSPNGQPRCTLRRSDSSSDIGCGQLTSLTQS